jgi:hypothetical protein
MPESFAIDRSMKVLFRCVPPAFFRLAGLEVDPSLIRLGDVSVNIPEFRADQVLIAHSPDGSPAWGVYLEYQLHPDPAVLATGSTNTPY